MTFPSEPLRVLHVIPAVAPRYGGPSRAVIDMCVALRERGVEAVLATTDADGRGRLDVPLGRPTEYQQVPSMFFRRRLSEGFKYSPALARWLDANVTRFDVAHVHAVFSYSSLAAGTACERRRIPVVLRPLGSLDPWSLRRHRVRKAFLWRLSAKRLVRSAAAMHYTTVEEQRLASQSVGAPPGVVIPLGVRALSTARGPGYPYVLALGRLHPKKRLERLIEAFLSVAGAPRFAEWQLVVAGDGDAAYVSALKRVVERLGGGGRVVFPGWLDGSARDRALAGASLLALVSWQENFGLAAAEAMAAGVPVLVSREVNLASDIEAAGAGWVGSAENGGIRSTLEAALSSSDERRRRGEAGRQLAAARFAWPAVAEQLEQLYHDIRKGAP